MMDPIRRRLPRLALCLLALPLLAAAGEPAATVAPGTVIRWPGEGLTRCGMDGKKWDPQEGSCWYALDLLRPKGETEVARWVEGKLETVRVRIDDYPYPVQHITLKDDSTVHLSQENIDRAARERKKVGAALSRRTARRFRLPLAAPLAKLPSGGRFGSRRFFNGEPRSPHSGADYAATAGTPVLSVANGTIALAEHHFFAGKSIFVDHGDGLISMYFHLSEIGVANGDTVRRGQRIGAVGSTGRSTGPHLHLGLRWRGARVDPAQLLGPVTAIPEVGR